MEGEGAFHFASGATYNGGFVNSQFDGEGKYTWADGATYQVCGVWGVGVWCLCGVWGVGVWCLCGV